MKIRKYLLSILLSVFLVLAIAYSSLLSHKLKRSKGDVTTISIDPSVLKEKLAKAPPAWMMKQIRRDLKAYEKGITPEMLDRAFSGEKIASYNLIRFSIRDRHLSFSHDEKNLYSRHFKELLGCIKKLNELVLLPNVDFIVSLQDGFDENPDLGPCFVFAKNEGLESMILVPDIKAMTGYGKLRGQIAKANLYSPWKEKASRAFWRGSSTGGFLTHSGWDQFARSKLVLLSLDHPHEVDARFHSVVQCEPGVREMIKARGLISAGVKKEDHLKYKYLVDVDGNSCSYERYFWLLASNSLVIKQVTPNVQWYYGALEPYKHYLPVKADLSDLLEKIQWAEEHDAESQAMAERSTQFTKDHLTSEDTLVYLYHLLVNYAACLKS